MSRSRNSRALNIEEVWAAANVRLAAVTLDNDTTVHTLFGNQMGACKGYNPKNKGKKSYQRMSSEGWCNRLNREVGGKVRG
jgi:hypothetical protein